MDEFSSRLKEVRKEKKLGQGDFGAIAGVQRETQLKYENGSRKPDSAYLIALANAGIDVQYLLTGIRRDGAGVMSSDEQSLLDSFRLSNEEGKRAALLVLDALSEKGQIDRKTLGAGQDANASYAMHQKKSSYRKDDEKEKK